MTCVIHHYVLCSNQCRSQNKIRTKSIFINEIRYQKIYGSMNTILRVTIKKLLIKCNGLRKELRSFFGNKRCDFHVPEERDRSYIDARWTL